MGPSCLKVRAGVVEGGLQHFSVSPRPLGFGFLGLGVWGLRVWGQGLTINVIGWVEPESMCGGLQDFSVSLISLRTYWVFELNWDLVGVGSGGF